MNTSSSVFEGSGKIPPTDERLSSLRMQSFETFRFSARLDERYKREHAEIGWQSISGMRNVLVHDYFEVDFESVWRIVERDLAPLEQTMRLILAKLDEL